MKVIGIIGSRSRNSDKDCMKVNKAFFDIYEFGDTIVSGGCPKGGDRFAERIAEIYGICIKIHPAEWNKYGKRAGYIRNQYIADDADILIACVAENRRGGTEDTIRKMKKGKKIILVY